MYTRSLYTWPLYTWPLYAWPLYTHRAVCGGSIRASPRGVAPGRGPRLAPGHFSPGTKQGRGLRLLTPTLFVKIPHTSICDCYPWTVGAIRGQQLCFRIPSRSLEARGNSLPLGIVKCGTSVRLPQRLVDRPEIRVPSQLAKSNRDCYLGLHLGRLLHGGRSVRDSRQLLRVQTYSARMHTANVRIAAPKRGRSGLFRRYVCL
jgi:hypothetical protein